MRLSKKIVEEFKDIYYKKFGEKLSDEKAKKLAKRLVLLYKAVYCPLPDGDKQDKSEKDSNLL